MNDELVKLIQLASARGANDCEIARVTGYSYAHIGGLRRAAGIPCAYRNPAGNVERIPQIIARLEAGASLQEIGDSLGITRERVRQIAAKKGVTGQVSMAKRKEIRQIDKGSRLEEAIKAREERYQGTYGCSYAEVVALNEGLPLSHPNSRSIGYRYWVRNVLGAMKSTGTLNFPEWCAVWGEHWKDRGRGDSYRLSRIDRTKAFTTDNVICERGNASMSRHRKLHPWQTASRV